MATPKKTKLPAALVANAARAATRKAERIKKEATSDVALVKRRKADVAESFYDIGLALTRLQRPEAFAALGYPSFEALCKTEFGFAAAQALRLIAIPAAMTRDDARAMGQSKAIALLGLASATPEADTATSLFRKKRVALPDGGTLSPKKASAREIERASGAIRRASGTAKDGRGRRIDPAATRAAAAIQAALGPESVIDVRAVAGAPGKVSTLRFEGVTVALLADLAAALKKAASAVKTASKET